MSAGRKTKLNKKFIQKAQELLEKGYYVNTACDYLGISERTWYNWYNKGEELSIEENLDESKLSKHEKECIQFFQTVKRATAQAEMKAVDRIKSAQQWQAVAWFLERRYRNKWGRPTKDEEDNATGKSQLDRFLQGLDNIAQEDDET